MELLSLLMIFSSVTFCRTDAGSNMIMIIFKALEANKPLNPTEGGAQVL